VPEFRKHILADLATLAPAAIPAGDGWTIFTQRRILLGSRARRFLDIHLNGPDAFTLQVEAEVESRGATQA
jgi:hypothetical protein